MSDFATETLGSESNLAHDQQHHCSAYGLTIASDFALPECKPLASSSTIDADLVIARGQVDGPMPEKGSDRLVRPDGDSIHLAWDQLGRIRINGGSRVTVDLLPEFDVQALGFVLLGPVMALLLHQRGNMILHGSAIGLADGSAILFLGDNGAGKSTLATACLKAGYELLADDVIAITGESNTCLLQPGFPAAKLSRAALGSFAPLPGILLPAVPPNAAKIRLRLPDIDERPRRIAHICVVTRGLAKPEPLSPADSLATLMRYSYLPKFGPDILSGSRAAEHFRACATLASQTPVSLLSVPDGLEQLVDFAATLPDRLRNSAA